MYDRLCAVALGNSPADLLLKNGRVVDVLTETIYEADVLVAEGRIAAVLPRGAACEAARTVDLAGAYLAPGLINAHCHVESSMATPEAYCAEELCWGVTTLITDPHEIANVAGAAGIRYMLRAGGGMPLNYYVELPSCVPATPFEHSGCVLDAAAVAELVDESGVLGLGEMMNVPGVLQGDADVWAKLRLFTERGRIIDGHAPLLSGRALQAYVGAGIATDHESISWTEAHEKLRAGLAVLVREGSASRNLRAILQGALREGASTRRMAFCTDDKHLADIRREGTIRHCVCMAIELGMSPVRALAMASLNAAQIYGLPRLGAIAPGWQADLVAFEDLRELRPLHVFHRGEDVAELCARTKPIVPEAELRGSVRLASVREQDFAVERFVAGRQYPVIRMLPGEIFTEHGTVCGEDVPAALADGSLHMIAVLERHHATDYRGLGLISGYGLREGAAATTVAHDSHNLIVIGSSARAMLTAVRELERVQGGYTLVRGNEVVGTVPLEICGLMSSAPTEELIVALERIAELAHEQGVPAEIDPFVSLSFMALPVIPKLRITDMGIFDVEKFEFI